MSNSHTPVPGFFGKLQSHGDFITRHLSNSFTQGWDQWLQESLAASKNQLDDDWLEIYLSSPVWHFALSPGICDSYSYAGILMPSVDKVGRYFPLTITISLAPELTNIQIKEKGKDWYNTAEHLALSTLADDFDFHDFEDQFESPESPLKNTFAGITPLTVGLNNHAIHITLTDEEEKSAQAWAQLANYSLTALYSTSSLWWTKGSDRVAPSLIACKGLPPTTGLSAFLDGNWGRWGWREHPEQQGGNP